MKDDKLYLIHISESLGRIASYVAAMDRQAFLASSLVQDAVIRNLQVMAESTQRLSNRLKDAHAEIDWYKIAGFRNVLVHDYLGVEMERVWDVVEKELPALEKAIRAMME